ncbi:MAG: hypothetical protein LBJ73_02495 [Rickettsiales bacterium]|jgi:hypothetical protein|nr:hypothetical protein [Rickettsiales bacterium]
MKKNPEQCDDKLKALEVTEKTLRQLYECKAKGISLADCDLTTVDGSNVNQDGSVSMPSGSGGNVLTTSVVAGASTLAAIVMATKAAKAAASTATQIAPTMASVVNLTPAQMTQLGLAPSNNPLGTGAAYRNTNPANGRVGYVSNAQVNQMAQQQLGITPPVASTNIQQTWRGARQSPGANANLRAGQVGGASLGGASAMAKVGGGLMAVGGVIGVIESASGNEEHGWGNVLSGALSGAAVGSGAAMALNVIPVYGQAAFIATIAVTTVAGALTGGSQMFSETDCARDPFITNADGSGVFTCCHTQFNKGQRWVDIGGDMTCGDKNSPGVRTCLNGGSETSKGIFKDDLFSAECKAKYCDGWDAPEQGSNVMYRAAAVPWERETELSGSAKTPADEILYHSGKLCWMWECEDGFSRVGGRCVSNASPVVAPNGGNGAQSIDDLIRQLEARAQAIRKECVK